MNNKFIPKDKSKIQFGNSNQTQKLVPKFTLENPPTNSTQLKL